MLLFIFLFPLSFSFGFGKKPPPPHSEVVNHILQDYDPHVAPLNSANTTLEVQAGLAMIHIDSLSESGILTATAWLRLVWNDFRLTWNKTEFGGVNVIRINPKRLWLPDIEVYNGASPSDYALSSQFSSRTNALIYPDGEALYIPPVSLKVICHNFSHSAWPQGEQECSIKLGSWTYDGLVLNLTLFNNKHEIDLTDMSQSSPWNITHQLGNSRNERFYTCCPEPYQDLNFRFKLKPQFPMKDPNAVSDLLSKLLEVSIAILTTLVIGGVCIIAYLFTRRGAETNSYKMKLLREASNNST